jgi:hypothetical protein
MGPETTQNNWNDDDWHPNEDLLYLSIKFKT